MEIIPAFTISGGSTIAAFGLLINLNSDLSDQQTTFILSEFDYLSIMSSSPPPAHDLHPSQRSQTSASSEYDTDLDASIDDDMEFDLAQELLEGDEEMEDDEDYEGVS